MSVLTQSTARQDVLLRRGVTTEWGIRWEHSDDGGHTFAPVDWAGWTGTVELVSLLGDVWWSAPVSLEASGLARLTVPADALTDPVWATRPQGEWRANITHTDGRVDRLGDGYIYVEE